MKRIIILASGSGSNAQRIVEHFHRGDRARVVLTGCDKAGAGVLQRAWDLGVPTYLFGANELNDGTLQKEMEALRPHLIVLAGFLRLIPSAMIKAFPDRIVNIHPSLLPKYGGKGMYGRRVHQAVIAAGETESGITIHLVNEKYDEGAILHQATCPVHKEDDPETLARRVLALEHEWYPVVVERCLVGRSGGPIHQVAG